MPGAGPAPDADGDADRPLVLLLHGFGEFWWSWRHQLVALTEAGQRLYPVLRDSFDNIGQTLAALRALGVRRLSLLTPYVAETTAPMAELFAAEGFALDRVTCMGLADDRAMARVDAATLVEQARAATAPGSDALFIACTALRAAAWIDRLEEAAGVPVVAAESESHREVVLELADERLVALRLVDRGKGVQGVVLRSQDGVEDAAGAVARRVPMRSPKNR